MAMRFQPSRERFRIDGEARRPRPNRQHQPQHDEDSREAKPDERRYSVSARHSLALNVQRVCRTRNARPPWIRARASRLLLSGPPYLDQHDQHGAVRGQAARFHRVCGRAHLRVVDRPPPHVPRVPAERRCQRERIAPTDDRERACHRAARVGHRDVDIGARFARDRTGDDARRRIEGQAGGKTARGERQRRLACDRDPEKGMDGAPSFRKIRPLREHAISDYRRMEATQPRSPVDLIGICIPGCSDVAGPRNASRGTRQIGSRIPIWRRGTPGQSFCTYRDGPHQLRPVERS